MAPVVSGVGPKGGRLLLELPLLSKPLPELRLIRSSLPPDITRILIEFPPVLFPMVAPAIAPEAS